MYNSNVTHKELYTYLNIMRYYKYLNNIFKMMLDLILRLFDLFEKYLRYITYYFKVGYTSLKVI